MKTLGLTKKEQARYRAIINELSRLSRNGWDRATHVDYEPREAELAAFGREDDEDVMTREKAERMSEAAIAVAGLRAGMRPAEVVDFLDNVRRWRELGVSVPEHDEVEEG